jgi:hypothetical protein
MAVAARLQSSQTQARLATLLGAPILGVVVAIVVTSRLQEVQAGVLMLIALGACFVFWRQGVYAVFVLVAMEGFFRNLLDSPQVLFVKDLMLAAIYLRVLGEQIIRHRRLLPPTAANVPILFFAGLVLAQTLNPNVLSAEQAAVGVHTWLFYVPLFFVAAEMIRTGKEAWRFLGFLLALAVPVSAVAIYQVLAGPEAYAGLGGAFAQATFVVGQDPSHAFAYRPNATFAWSSHFAAFIAIVTLVAGGLLLRETGWRMIGALALLAFLAGVDAVEGQRSFFLLLPPILILMVWWQRAFRSGTVLVAVALVIGAVMVNALVLFAASPFGALDRPLALLFGPESKDIAVHVGAYLEVVRQSIEASPIGLGTGATSLGTRHALGYIPMFVESVPAKVIGDLSLLGLVVYAWLMVVLVVSTLRIHSAARKAGDRSLATHAAAVLGIQLLVLYAGTDIAVAAMLFWFLSGSIAGQTAVSEAPATAGVGARRLAWSWR